MRHSRHLFHACIAAALAATGLLGTPGSAVATDQPVETATYPPARGWSSSVHDVRVTGPDRDCTYLLWLAVESPHGEIMVNVAPSPHQVRTHALVRGAMPTPVSLPQSCVDQRYTVNTWAPDKPLATQKLTLPAPQYGVRGVTARHSAGGSLVVTGTASQAGIDLPATTGSQQPTPRTIKHVRAAFLDYDLTTRTRCAWLTAAGARVTYTSRANDPGCERAVTSVATVDVTGDRWRLTFRARHHAGRLVIRDDRTAVRQTLAVPRGRR